MDDHPSIPAVLELIEQLRHRLRRQVAEPRRWLGTLRQLSLARAVQGSNRIEGYDAPLDDVVAALNHQETIEARHPTRQALDGYLDAMTYVLQLARGPESTAIDQSLIKALHFMMLEHDLDRNPGRWRPGAIYVRRDPDGAVVHEGPDVDLVAPLMDELVADLATSDQPTLVRGAMAHLNLVMIHPFSDGNGRMARCLQSLVLARDQILSPEFNSIEEYLGANTAEYYDVLAATGGGGWHPENDTTAWVRFCLTAHYRQALRIEQVIKDAERRWDLISELIVEIGAPPRAVGPLFDSSLGLRLRNASYRSAVVQSEGEQISEQTASRDLKVLVDAAALEASGEKRGRTYRSGARLSAVNHLMKVIGSIRPSDDPFEIVAG